MYSQEEMLNIVRIHLPQTAKEQVEVMRLGGLSNYMHLLKFEDGLKIIFRQFKGLQSRTHQNKIMDELGSLGLSPKYLFCCEDYRIERCIEGKHPSNAELASEQILRKVLHKMHSLHQVQISAAKKLPSIVSTLLSDTHAQSLTKISNTFKRDKFEELQQELIQIHSDSQSLRIKLEPQNDLLVFCHNDLNNLNIFLTKQEQIALIDFEYSCYNYASFDVANFLNETCIDYSTPMAPLFALLKKFTTKEIEQLSKLYPGWEEGFERDVLKGLCLCNLYWAAWSLKTSMEPSHSEFGMIEHGKMRLGLYKYYLGLL